MTSQAPVGGRPPRWAEYVLQVLLKPRDRETIAGDLLEEYREVILPARGRLRAQLWYLRQALSLVSGVMLGAVVGAGFGAWNLIFTWLVPLAEDTPIALASFYGPMFVIWGFAGFAAYRRTGRLRQAAKVGATVAFVTFVVFDVFAIIRVNLFLDTISQRSDWRNLVVNYQDSGFESLRSYANYVYLTGAHLKILVASMIGAVTGLIGGLLGTVGWNKRVLLGGVLIACAVTVSAQGVQRIDLAERLAGGKLRTVNRDVTKLQGSRDGVHVSEKAGPGVVWIEGSDFAEGTIEVDVRGRDVLQQSFLGVAFHRKDDNTYDAVYLRPFNFRAADPDRHQHAVQYVAVPDYDWPRLRKEFPEEFENPVDQSIVPTDWVPLRIVVKGKTVQIHAGAVKAPTLEVRKLGTHDRGLIGLWVGNNSDGAFANLRITPMK